MRNKTVQITIPTPCQQRWQDMKAEETGRFCASCQKTVVDFSTLTDQMVISLLAQQNGLSCGRFQVSQLDREMTVAAPVSHSPVRLLSWLIVGVLGYQTVNANPLPTEAESTAIPIMGKKLVDPSPSVTDKKPPTDSVRVITGRVVEHTTNAGIPGATVVIKGMARGASTDDEGHFQVSIPANLAKEQITLQIASVGYLTQEIQLNTDQSNSALISLSEDVVALNQVIVMGYTVRRDYKKPTVFQRLRNRLRGNH